jgi:hypothetical protein
MSSPSLSVALGQIQVGVIGRKSAKMKRNQWGMVRVQKLHCGVTDPRTGSPLKTEMFDARGHSIFESRKVQERFEGCETFYVAT